MRYRYPQRGGCVPFVCFLYGWNGWYGLEGYLNGIGRAIVLARENDTPDRWGDWGSAHSQQNRDWAFLRSAFPPPLAAEDWARPYGLRIPSLLAGGALAEMNRCACSTPFFVLTVLLQASLQRPVQNKKTGRFSSSGSFQRRGRDSNPRILSDQRFSRPPQSTTLPPLQVLRVCFGIAKVGIIFLSPNLFSGKLIFSAK